jgi:hypothetical protein
MSGVTIVDPNDLPPELLEDPQQIKVVVETVWRMLTERAEKLPPTVTPGRAKDIIGVTELIEQAIRDYEKRERTTVGAKVEIVWERPEKPFESEVIALSIASREPGSFSQGRPFEGKEKNRRPIVREIVNDPDNPGYKRIVLGFFYDNTLRITAWARTNKEATKRAIWVEDMIEDYSWWFTRSGVNRILFEKWLFPVFMEVNNNPYYGRPIDYFVRTEKLFNISQKTLEEIYIRMAFGDRAK